jgi:hypothetical protein
MSYRIRLAILPGRSKLKIQKNSRNLRLWSRQPKRVRLKNLLKRKRMTTLLRKDHTAVLCGKKLTKIRCRSVARTKSRKTSLDQASKGNKNKWTNKELNVLIRWTDSLNKIRVALPLMKRLHFQSLLLREWDSWKSSRISKIKRMSKLHIERVLKKLSSVQTMSNQMWKKTRRQKKKYQKVFCSLLLIKNSFKQRLKRKKTCKTSMNYLTSIQMSLTTANSFAVKS